MSIHGNVPGNGPVGGPDPDASPPWAFSHPNTADFNFNYYKLLAGAEASAIAKLGGLRIAVLGAGISGLTAARELYRCGLTQIDIYEASDRIGGRAYSQALPGRETVLEMGAMRMPFFKEPGDENCVLDYYRRLFDIRTSPFPNSHVPSVKYTGVWVNEGYGPDPKNPYPNPTLIRWAATEDKPPDPFLSAIYDKWRHFASFFTNPEKGPVVATYNEGGDAWRKLWQAIVQRYWTLDFRELVNLPQIAKYDPRNPGDFGGLGMDQKEARAFYTIGAGDGSWGAFYDISCLYPIRTLLFGFADKHQLIEGPDPIPSPPAGSDHEGTLTDSAGAILQAPLFRGVQSFPEGLFYLPVKSEFVDPISLYQATKDPTLAVNLFTGMPVTKLAEDPSGGVIATSSQGPQRYDAVIVTPSTWALQVSCELDFKNEKLPFEAKQSIDASHWISSTKVFYPLEQRYWEVSDIPQVISTDTFLKDAYGYAAGETDPGVLLLSYTWEDDANKLDAETDDARLAAKCLARMDEITSVGCGQHISHYVDQSSPVVFRWSRLPYYRGCAKLYRQRSWAMDYALLTHNQQRGKKSGLYFAGEGYSVEGGWVEPALRLALDAVINIANDHCGCFLNGFSYDLYPQYVEFDPGDPAASPPF